MEYLRLAYFFIPIILAGISNMLFMKVTVGDFLKLPMDGGRCASDGKRILGANKTWKGFIGMIILTIFWFFIASLVVKHFAISTENFIIDFNRHHFALVGLACGLGYALAELPNSFLKRRLDIAPGTNSYASAKGIFFMFLDQVDSVIGCLLALSFFYAIKGEEIFYIILLGPCVHYVINIVLYLLGLKKQLG